MTADKDYTWYNTPEARRVSKIIRYSRTRRGMTPEELAEHLNISRSAIYRWENMRLPRATVTILNWLLEENGEESALYWRERATAAETALQTITNASIKFQKDLRELSEGDSSNVTNLSSNARRAH